MVHLKLAHGTIITPQCHSNSDIQQGKKANEYKHHIRHKISKKCDCTNTTLAHDTYMLSNTKKVFFFVFLCL